MKWTGVLFTVSLSPPANLFQINKVWERESKPVMSQIKTYIIWREKKDLFNFLILSASVTTFNGIQREIKFAYSRWQRSFPKDRTSYWYSDPEILVSTVFHSSTEFARRSNFELSAISRVRVAPLEIPECHTFSSFSTTCHLRSFSVQGCLWNFNTPRVPNEILKGLHICIPWE